MRNYMKELSCILLELDEISDDITIYRDKIIDLVKKYNDILRIKGDNQLLMFEDKNVLLAPVTMPCIGKGEALDYVYFGLNAVYSENEIYLEKEKAYTFKGGYYDFYNDTKGIIEFLLKDNKNTYYQRVMKVLYSIDDVRKEEILPSIGNMRKEFMVPKGEFAYSNDHLIFEGLMQDKVVAFPELIPFHSKKFGSGADAVKKLMNEMPSYKNYIDRLIESIFSNLASDGIVIANGAPVKAILEEVLSEKEASIVYEGPEMVVYKLNGSLWILLRAQIGSQSCEIRKNYDFKLFGDIVNGLKNLKDDKIHTKSVLSGIDWILEEKDQNVDFASGESMGDKTMERVQKNDDEISTWNDARPWFGNSVKNYLINHGYKIYNDRSNTRIRCNPIEISANLPNSKTKGVKGTSLQFQIEIRDCKATISYMIFDTDHSDTLPYIDKLYEEGVIENKGFIGQDSEVVDSVSIKYDLMNENKEDILPRILFALDGFLKCYKKDIISILG